MGKFKFVKRIDLQPLGAPEGSYLEFAPLTWREVQELSNEEQPELPDNPTPEQQRAASLKIAEQMMELIKTKFLGGVIGGVNVTADDLIDLDPLVLAEARKLVIPEAPNPNS